MTPTDLETFIRQRYNAVGDNFYPQAEIFNFIYAAQMELALEIFCIKTTYTTTSVASQRAYDLPSLSFSVRRIEYDGMRIYPNDFIDDDALTGNYPDETSTGVPVNYQTWGDQFYLRPVPSESSKTIKVYSYNMPDIVTATSTLGVPVRYHLMMVDYALYCMFSQDKNFDLSEHHRGIWEKHKKLALQTERLRDSGDGYKVVKSVDDIQIDSRFY
jgi:hypothetical protein